MPRDRLTEFAELGQFAVDAAAVRLLPETLCRRQRVVVLDALPDDPRAAVPVGMLDPEDAALVGLLGRELHRHIRPVRLNAYEIAKALDLGFGRPHADAHTAEADLLLDLGAPETDPDPDDPVALTDDMLRHALRLGASDIHVEVYRDDVDVRLRIDGVMHQTRTALSPENAPGVVSRLKILSRLDIADRRVPQDGRFRALLRDGESRRVVDFRINTCPAPHGEDAVLRVLGGTAGRLPLEKLGMAPALESAFLALLGNPEGMVLVTGPTGSGKTTTLYAALDHLDDGQRKIVTAEDPIEYELPKISQKQVGPGLGYPELARAFLRMDPDVMLIGEVRDEETAVAIARAASTGHLALSTLHTTDAFGAIPRLAGLGLGRSDLANVLLGVLAQRLVRRICPACATEVPVDDRSKALLGPLAPSRAMAGAGCEACHGTGYAGRVGIYELFSVDHTAQDLLHDGAPLPTLRRHAHRAGFHSLVHDSVAKVEAGETTLEEILRVLPYRYVAELTSQG